MKERVLGYGVIGTGVYCDHYFGTLGPVFKNLRPIGCSDLNTEAAKAAAARWNGCAGSCPGGPGRCGWF